MDKTRNQSSNWSWLPEKMPGVAKRIAEFRERFGAEHMSECWQKGVVQLQPGWFFAREGALAVGTPWDHPDVANFAAKQITSTQALVVIRDPEVNDGAH
jgi:hypothetical protein